jgi:hypothetical protein
MFAVLYKFGLQHAVGADALSDFFKLIRIGTHVGISPSALRTQLSKMEALILTFQDSCEQSAPAQTRKAVLAADESVPRRRAQKVKVLQCSYAAQEMRVGPSESPYRRRLQTTYCCCV